MPAEQTYYSTIETYYGTLYLHTSLDKIYKLSLTPLPADEICREGALTPSIKPTVLIDTERDGTRSLQSFPEDLYQLQQEIILTLQQPNHSNLTEFNKKLAPQGTEFQQEVWQALLTIPCGETRSYQEVAQMINRPKATRAVASAIGKNPINYLIPCHRVIRSDGGLGGYYWGLEEKVKVLEYEKKICNNSK